MPVDRLGSTSGFVPPPDGDPSEFTRPEPPEITRGRWYAKRDTSARPAEDATDPKPEETPNDNSSNKPTSDQSSVVAAGHTEPVDLPAEPEIPEFDPFVISSGSIGLTREGMLVQSDVRKMLRAFFRGDSEMILAYSHPLIIEEMGGATRARAFLDNQLKNTLSTGLRAVMFEFHRRPFFIRGKENHYVVIPTHSIFAVGSKRIETIDFQVGIRPIGQPGWTYVDGSKINEQNIRDYFPDFPTTYQLPDIVRRDPDAPEPPPAEEKDPPVENTTETTEDDHQADESELPDSQPEEVPNDPDSTEPQPTEEVTDTQPVEEPTEPTTEPIEPIEPTEPITEPIEPITEPIEPITKPTEPTEPTEPSSTEQAGDNTTPPELPILVTPEIRQVQTDVRYIIDAFFRGDTGTMIVYMNRKVLDLMGGPTQAKESLDKSLRRLLATGIKMDSFEFRGVPKFIQTEKHRFAIIPTRSVYALKDKRLESYNFQLGVLPAGEQKWTYIEGTQINKENAQRFFPDFPADFDFPVVKQFDPDAPPKEPTVEEGDDAPPFRRN